MKHAFKSWIALMAAAAAVTGCATDPDQPAPRDHGFRLELVADSRTADAAAPASRTEWDDALRNICWSADDAAYIFIGTRYVANAAATLTATPSGGNTATFGGTFYDITAPGTYTAQAFCPSSAFNKVYHNADGTEVLVYELTLPGNQTATATSFDPRSDILIARNMPVEITADDVAAQSKRIADYRFGRPMAVSRYAFTLSHPDLASDETVESVTLTVEGATPKYLTGRFRFAPATGRFVSDAAGTPIDDLNDVFYYGASNSVTVTFAGGVTLGGLNMWAVTAPVTLAAGDRMVFTIETDRHTIVRTATLTRDVSFVATQLNTATVALGTEEIVVTPKAAGAQAVLTSDEMRSLKGSSNAYGTLKSYTNAFGTWASNGYKATGDQSDNYIQLNGNYYFQLPELLGTIRSVELEVGSASAAKPGGNSKSFYFREGPASTQNIAAATGAAAVTLTLPEASSYATGCIFVSGAARIFSVKITYTPTTDPLIRASDIVDIAAAGGDLEAAYEVINSASDVAESPSVDGTVVTYAAAQGGTLLYAVAPNYGADAREGWIEYALADNAAVTKRIAVKQLGSTFEVPASVSIAAEAEAVTFNLLSADFGWTITPPEGITVDPATGAASATPVLVTVTSQTPNPGTETLLLGTLSILRTGETTPTAIAVNKLAPGAIGSETFTECFAALSTPGVGTTSGYANMSERMGDVCMWTGTKVSTKMAGANATISTSPTKVAVQASSGSLISEILHGGIRSVRFDCNSNKDGAKITLTILYGADFASEATVVQTVEAKGKEVLMIDADAVDLTSYGITGDFKLRFTSATGYGAVTNLVWTN